MSSQEPNLGAVFGRSAKERAAAPDPKKHAMPPRRRPAASSASPQPSTAGRTDTPPPETTPPAPSQPEPVADQKRPEPPVETEHQADTATDQDDDVAGLVTQVSVYLLPSAVTAARRWRTRTGRTNARLAFEAIAAHRDQLPTLVAGYDQVSDPVAASADALFPPSPRSRRARPGTHRVLWTLKATAGQLAVLDRLAREVGATSRSELIAAAVEAHVLTRRQPARRRESEPA